MSYSDLCGELYDADATDLPFKDGYFDCVYSFGVLHHIPEIETCVSEIHRVLKPGGMFLFGLYHKWSAFHIFCKLIANGVWCGDLFRLGYGGMLATIESGADGKNIKPYVKLCSIREIRKLLAGFSVSDVSIHRLHADHFYPGCSGLR